MTKNPAWMAPLRGKRFVRFMGILLLTNLFPCRMHAAFLDQGAGARGPGMGDAMVAIADDVFAVHYNPAGLALLQSTELGLSYNRLLLGLGDNTNLSDGFLGAAHPIMGGSQGGAAVSWSQYALNSNQYREDSYALGYGRRVAERLGPGDLYAGVAGRYLRRRFSAPSEGAEAMSGLAATGQRDPLLEGGRATGALDADLGLLYRLKTNYAAGLSVRHLAGPDVSFSGSGVDRLPRELRVGLSYRSMLSTVGLQYETRTSQVFTTDHRGTVAAERWFLKLFLGDFGLRAALTVGTREFTQVSAGFSYRTRRLGVDYAFQLPINTVASTAGTHRLGFKVRFGGLRESDESVVMILEAMRSLKAGRIPEYITDPVVPPLQMAELSERLAHTRSLQAQAKYQDALDQLSSALRASPTDKNLLAAFGRLNFVAKSIKSLPNYKSEPAEAALYEGISAYLGGNYVASLERVAYAASLKPDNRLWQGFLEDLEAVTHLKAPSFDKAAPESLWRQGLLMRAAAALEEGRYDEAVSLSREVLSKDENVQVAWENLGTAYFAQGDYVKSMEAWRKAAALEKDSARRETLRGYVESVRRVLAKRVAAAKALAPARAPASPEEIRRLYNQGLDLYNAGRLDDAVEAFESVLELDPSFVSATKALNRVKGELRR